MFVDLVRAGNDQGSLGFLSKKERLNVLLTRQNQHLFLVGDTTCCETDTAGASTVLKWFQEHGRISPVAMDQEVCDIPANEEPSEGVGLAALGDDDKEKEKEIKWVVQHSTDEGIGGW